MDPRHETGVTLVELLVTVGVLTILASFAVPSFTAIMQNNGLTASVNSLVTSVTLARSEALKRNAPITICRSNNANADSPGCGGGTGWESGWVVFVDENGNAAIDADEDILGREAGLPSGAVRVLVPSTDAPLDASLTYLPTGFPDFAVAIDGGRDLLFCDERDDNAVARVINVSQTGRTQVRSREATGDIGVSCEE
ncbi:MAG: GspH/FimT family pseudopilin [Pseudomonadota bacterium]